MPPLVCEPAESVWELLDSPPESACDNRVVERRAIGGAAPAVLGICPALAECCGGGATAFFGLDALAAFLGGRGAFFFCGCVSVRFFLFFFCRCFFRSYPPL